MNNLRKIIQIFSEFLRDYPKQFLSLLSLLILEGLIAASAVLTLAPLADYLLDSSLSNPSQITSKVLGVVSYLELDPSFLLFASLFLVSNFVKGFLELMVRYGVLRIKYQVLRGLIGGTLDLFLQARWSFFSGSEQGKLLNTFNRELTTIGDTLGHLTMQFAQGLQLIIYLMVPLWLNPQVTLSAVGIVVGFALPFLMLHRLSYRLGKRNTETANIAIGFLAESLSAARLILGYGLQKRTLERYLRVFDQHIRATLRSQVLGSAIPALFQPLGILAGMLALGLALSQGFPLAEMAAILWSFLRAMPVLSSLLQTNISLSNFLPSYEQLLVLRTQAESVQEVQGSRKFKRLREGIELQQVQFAYPGRALTLNKINLSVKQGEMTALVGESGSGKSTLVDLMLGLQIPEQGQVLLEKYPLEEWDRNSFREKIGYVPQDPQLLHTSLRENLLWVRPDANEKELWNVCRVANAENFVRELPDGLETVVGDRGVRLSGGQCQRIALARALLRQPELLILDEATSALDGESEKLIQGSLDKLVNSTTILVIAHRFSTISRANRIHVLHQGKIIESGTYAELVEANSRFAQMVRLQQFAA